jgi:hypothetical protein
MPWLRDQTNDEPSESSGNGRNDKSERDQHEVGYG